MSYLGGRDCAWARVKSTRILRNVRYSGAHTLETLSVDPKVICIMSVWLTSYGGSCSIEVTMVTNLPQVLCHESLRMIKAVSCYTGSFSGTSIMMMRVHGQAS